MQVKGRFFHWPVLLPLLQWSRRARCRTWVEFPFKLQKLSHFSLLDHIGVFPLHHPHRSQKASRFTHQHLLDLCCLVQMSTTQRKKKNDSFPPLWNTALPLLSWAASREHNDKAKCRHTWSCGINKMFLFSFTLTVEYRPAVRQQIKCYRSPEIMHSEVPKEQPC